MEAIRDGADFPNLQTGVLGSNPQTIRKQWSSPHGPLRIDINKTHCATLTIQ
jgi:hypothetical protein